MDVATNYNEASFKSLFSVLLLFKCDQASDLWQQLDDDDDGDDESFLRNVDCRKAFISSRDHRHRFPHGKSTRRKRNLNLPKT